MKNIACHILVGALAAGAAVSGLRAGGPTRTIVEQSHGDYLVRIDRKYESLLEIFRDGERVYEDRGYSFKVGSIYEEYKTDSLISIGSDITGDGQPNLVISEWTGGAHCCYRFHVFEIGERFRHIQTIDAGHSELADFRNLDGDSALEFPTADWTFSYWKTGFISSPAPRVILKYDGERYSLAADLMRKPGLPEDELIEKAADIGESPDWKPEHPPVEMWSLMLDLIYTGNMDQAWKLAGLSWPAGIEGREQFLEDFRAKLAESPYWNGIRKLNEKSPRRPEASDGS